MNIAACLLDLLACMCGLAAGANQPVLACNAKAISAAERPRYNELVQKIRLSLRDRRELPDGYAFRLAERFISLGDVAEWIRMERRCCPFLVFRLELAGPVTDMELTLRGPSGTKAVLESAFPK
jgi:hypothetical protein